MNAPRAIAPREALHALMAKVSLKAPAAFPIEEAPCGYLAEPLEILPRPAPSRTGGAGGQVGGHRRAVINGYALAPEVSAGDELPVLGVLAAETELHADTLLPTTASPPPGVAGKGATSGVWRVETGAALPDVIDRIAPVSSTVLTAERRVRIEKLPSPGEGLSRPLPSTAERAAAARVLLPAGTRVDPRLLSFLAAQGARSVTLRPAFGVGFATIGDELIEAPASCGAGHRLDLTAPWLEAAIAGLGLAPAPLGILPDSPAAIRDAILHARGRRLEILLLVGGMGDGVTDRTVEGLRRFEASVLMERLSLDGCPHLALAKTQGLDILAWCGRPLAAAACFDLFVRPALLARMGAPRAALDWSLTCWPLLNTSPYLEMTWSDAEWLARPASLAPAAEGGLGIRCWEAESPFLPLSPGQEGWAVLDGRSRPPAQTRTAHFQPRWA